MYLILDIFFPVIFAYWIYKDSKIIMPLIKTSKDCKFVFKTTIISTLMVIFGIFNLVQAIKYFI